MTSRLRRILGLALAIGLGGGCGSTTGSSCGAGTIEANGTCIPDPAALECGAGTVLSDGACVAADVTTPLEDAESPTDTAPLPDTTEGDVSPVDDLPTGDDVLLGDTPEDDTADVPSPDDDVLPGDVTVCVPDCAFKQCGDDGCGGSCGVCGSLEAPICNTQFGICVSTCTPQCVGKDCGDDGCGGTCGACGESHQCSPAIGRCVALGWSCDANWYADYAVCDCGCGAPDLDCGDAFAALAGCEEHEQCNPSGVCVPSAPEAWTCAASRYDDFGACDCDCGAPDPDCSVTGLPVLGCVGDEASCNPDGTCAACVPDCDGQECGSDGCGGVCGFCTDPAKKSCFDGQCVNPCLPTPVVCFLNECGDDGCGGVCGHCGADAVCESGTCSNIGDTGDPTSCKGNCGSVAPSGCYCTESCVAKGTCCDDYEASCSCTPDCNGKECGQDGCGGSCGQCSGSTPYCDGGACTAECTPSCQGKTCGDDGCGGVCGTCGPGSSCSWTDQCVPVGWICEPYFYADELGCDCGCGVPDPDCQAEGSTVYGCPTAATACTSSGVCDVDFCNQASDCPSGWCMGAYYEGDGHYAGVCDIPVPDGEPLGTPCSFDAECASLNCTAEACRQYCVSDADCPGVLRCLGLPREDPVTLSVTGYVPACEAITGTGTPCSAQADCKPIGEVCRAFVDPGTLAPKYRCDQAPPPGTIGKSCETFDCAGSAFCAEAGGAHVCTVPCPAGNADCPPGWSCGVATFHDVGTPDPTDDPEVPVCLP
ncbi:MAG: hypothetical protein IV100_07525 [Myxococcales bacterium]|nr:hypothetical protein [Myxococcales bacterium]